MSAPDQIALHERILEEATRLFVSYGYHGISMREIAEAVGVSKAGLYYHFKDKEDLFLAILAANLDAIQRIVQETRQERTTRERIGRMVRGLFAQTPEQRAIIRLATQEIAYVGQAARATFGRIYQEKFIGQIEAMLSDGIARGELRELDARLATWLLLGMLYPFFNPEHEREDGPRETAISLILTTFFDGLSRAYLFTSLVTIVNGNRTVPSW
jgi:AcrR family transcriptional regulator